MIIMLLSPYDESTLKRRYIGRIVTEYDGDDNPYTSQSRYLGVERSSYSVYINGFHRYLTDEERRMSDEELIANIQSTY